MRIIAGRLRGRSLAAPAGLDVRPTAERVREALFNVLAHNDYGPDDSPPLQGARVIDAFAGTGALGFEALSRGAQHVTFFENDPTAHRALHANAAALGVTGEIAIVPSDATRPGPSLGAAALAFLDPPYDSGLAAPALAAFAAGGWLADGALAVVELAAKEAFSPPIGFETVDARRYGAARLIFLRHAP